MTSSTAVPRRPLTFEVVGGDQVDLADFDLVVAGYTGRDEESVKKHIDELAAIGVPPPASFPTFFELDSAILTQEPEIVVAGANTSGEVEPVLVRAAGRLYLGVGSDHTDRDIERTDITESKACCPKPVSSRLVAFDSVDFDAIEAECTVDGVRYQHGLLSALRVPTDVLALYDERSGRGDRDVVMYGGTLPLIGGAFVPGYRWTLSLKLPGGAELRHSYATSVQPG